MARHNRLSVHALKPLWIIFDWDVEQKLASITLPNKAWQSRTSNFARVPWAMLLPVSGAIIQFQACEK